MFTEVERQFGVKVELELEDTNRSYTGLFHSNDDVRDVMKSICLPMNLVFGQVEEELFLVTD